MRYSNEVKVGVVFLTGLFVIIFGYFWLRGVGLGADLYYVKLNGAAQIAQGNDVRLQGVKIGQVQEVDFDPQTQQPVLTLAVRKGKPPFKLLKNYQYSVQSAGIVGENYFDIRGPFTPTAATYEPNDETEIIPGKAGGGITAVTDVAADVAKDFRATLENLNVTLDRVNKGVLNYQNQIKLARALDGVARLTNSASQSFGPGGVRVGLADPAAQRDLNRAVANLAAASQSGQIAARNIEITSRQFGGITGETAGLVRDLRGTLGDNRRRLTLLLGSLDRAANNVAGVTETLDFALKQGGFRENTQLAFQSLRRAAENVEVATGGLRRLSEDQGTQDDLKRTLSALRESTEALRDTAVVVRTAIADDKNREQIGGALASLSATAKNLENVSAGLNNIVGDAQLQANVKEAAANLNTTLEATSAAAQRINGLLGGRKPKTGTSGNGAANEIGAPSNFPTGIDFTYRRFLDTPNLNGASDVSGRNFGDATFNGELFGGPFRMGIAGIGEGNDLTLQSGQFFGQNAAVRYGLYRSKLGAGVELRRGRYSLEGNLWDPNNRSYNFYGGVQATKNLQIIVGRENLRGDGTNAVGVRITR